MRRLSVIYVVVGALLVLTALALWLRSQQLFQLPAAPQLTAIIAMNTPAPEFALPALAGQTVRLAELRGKKIILNFWASWCGPCRTEMPDLEAVYQQYKESFILLGINIAEGPETVKKFLDEVRIGYPIALDTQGHVARTYGVIAQPATFWIDELGRIIYRKFGAYTKAELEEQITAFLDLAPAAQSLQQHHSATQLRHDNLGEKYFSEEDRARLGFKIDLSQVPYVGDLDLERVQLGCPIHDCIPSIDGPRFETVVEADLWLKSDDLVVSVTHNGVTKAYPVKILNWHEIVNDDFNGVPLVITYCPLCNSSLVFVRPTVKDKILEFGVSGRLYKSDLVMYDRQAGSFWSQIEGRAIIGPLAGMELELAPVEMLTWKIWRTRFDLSFVLARPTIYAAIGEQPARYEIDPYSLYKANTLDTFGTPFSDTRLESKTLIWGLVLGKIAKAYLPQSVASWGALNDQIADQPILVLWDAESVRFFARRWEDRTLNFNRRDGQIIDTETQSIWNSDGEAISGALQGTKLKRLSGIPAFWFAWLAFYPKTELYR